MTPGHYAQTLLILPKLNMMSKLTAYLNRSSRVARDATARGRSLILHALPHQHAREREKEDNLSLPQSPPHDPALHTNT